MFSLLWSEHCAYKHSRKLLRRLPTEGPGCCSAPARTPAPSTSARARAIAFKVESHNHPSAVEPFQGAATGVGGILRDVFALGARPIAVLDSLRFGELSSERVALPARPGGRGHRPLRQLDRGADGGRRDLLRAAYEQNCLVNAMCVGLARQTAWSARPPPGPATRWCCSGPPPVATASAAPRCWPPLSSPRARRSGPRVQIGDPFEEKKLMECCLELLDRAARRRSRTWAPPASPRPRPRWRRPEVSGSRSPSTGCHCASPEWRRSRS